MKSPTSPASSAPPPPASPPAAPAVSAASVAPAPVARKTPSFSLGDAVARSLRPARGIIASAQEGARNAFSTTGSLGRALKDVPAPSEIFASLSALLRRVLNRVIPQKFAGNPVLVGVAAGGVLVVALVGIGFLKFDSVTVSEGIATTNGPSEGKSFLIEKTRSADQNDLVVGLKPGSIEGQDEELVMGTVFSKNEETYAVLGDNVVWQVPVGDLRGKVWFATPLP